VREKVPEETVNDELEELIKRTHQAIVVEGRNGNGLAVSSGGSRSRNEK
jgi:hypothetical protein